MKTRSKKHRHTRARTLREFVGGGSGKIFLCELLLDEEGAQMRELPCAGHAEDDQLEEDPSYHARVGGLGLVAEFGFAFLEGGGVSFGLV